MLERNRIYHGDCLEVMKKIKSGSIDMILCDLPYGMTKNKWDSVIPLEKLWGEYDRIIKENGVIALTAQTPFDKILGSSNITNLKYEWIWEKDVATGHLNANRMPLRKHENILIFYKSPPMYIPQMKKGEPYIRKRKLVDDSGTNYSRVRRSDTINNGTRYPTTILKFNREIGFHPTQKPTDLFEYLIRTYTKKGETVLDNCIGSGTTAIAALRADRFFIGIEKEKKYVDIANKRIENFLSENPLNR